MKSWFLPPGQIFILRVESSKCDQPLIIFNLLSNYYNILFKIYDSPADSNVSYFVYLLILSLQLIELSAPNIVSFLLYFPISFFVKQHLWRIYYLLNLIVCKLNFLKLIKFLDLFTWKRELSKINLLIYNFQRFKRYGVWVLISKWIMKTCRVGNRFLPYWLIVVSFLLNSFIVEVSGNLLDILVHFHNSSQLHVVLNTQVKFLIFCLNLCRHWSLAVNKFVVVLLADFIDFKIIFTLLDCLLHHVWYSNLFTFVHPDYW